jgi:hypothetical protein
MEEAARQVQRRRCSLARVTGQQLALLLALAHRKMAPRLLPPNWNEYVMTTIRVY